MKDKCIVVTGSSSGIGYGITSKLLDLGAKVIGIARNHNKSKIKNKNYISLTFFSNENSANCLLVITSFDFPF